MELSHYQQAILQAVREGLGNILVKALAGSSKTTVLTLALSGLPQTTRAAFLAFGKQNAATLKERLPRHVHTSTLNSLGFWSCRMHQPEVKVNGEKVWTLLKMNYPETSRDLLYQVRGLISLAKAYGYGYNSYRQFPLEPATHDAWFYLMTRHALDIDAQDQEEVIDVADDILRMNNEITDEIDFDDQVYFPVIFNYRTPKFDFVGLDEAADVSYIQRAFVKKILLPGGRLLACGDEKQAIMAFRGADSESMNCIQQEFNCKVLPLSITYRCPKVVVREANVLVPELEAAPWAEEGKLLRPQYYDTELFKDTTNGAIICRNNAPLMTMAIKLLKNKVRFYMLRHGDVVEGLKNFIERFNAQNITDLYDKLSRWELREIDHCLARGQEMKAQYITDKAECIRCLAQESSTLDDLLALLSDIFSQKGNLTLGTIFAVKGLEYDDVFFLDKWLIPSKYARQQWQIQAEKNILYVGITRTIKRLFYINSLGMK